MATWTGPVANVRGPPGPQGPAGAASTVPGPQGPQGVGVPAGGGAGMLLTKRTATNFDSRWSQGAFVGGMGGTGTLTGTNWRMFGWTVYFTLASTGRFIAMFNGELNRTGTGNGGVYVSLRWGADPAPGAGTPVSGNALGWNIGLLNVPSGIWVPGTIIGIANAANGNYWIDIAAACENNNDTGTVQGYGYVMEI